MATVKFDSDGDVVEDTIDSNEPNALSDLYLINRDNGNTGYAIEESILNSDDLDVSDDADLQIREWAKMLKNVEINGKSLGDIQSDVTTFHTGQYTGKNTVGDAVNASEPREAERKFLNRSDAIEHIDAPSTTETVYFDVSDIRVPTAADGTRLPLIVMSNERSEQFHTLEEAEEILEKVIESRIDVDDAAIETDTSSNESTTETDDDSDDDDESDLQPINDPTRVDKIGSATIERLENAGFDVVPSAERHHEASVPVYDFEKSDDTEPDTSDDYTFGEVMDEYEKVNDDLSDFAQEQVEEKIGNEEFAEAMDFIERQME